MNEPVIPNKNEFVENIENNLRQKYAVRIAELKQRIIRELPLAKVDLFIFPPEVVELVKEDFRKAGWYVYQHRTGFFVKKDILVVCSEREDPIWI